MQDMNHLLPKNMRQMGEKEDRIKIYLEDYVASYFGRLELSTEPWRVGVLLGMHQEREGVPCLFISGAIETRSADFASGRLKFTEDTWRDVFRNMEKYFPGIGVCGWFVYEKSGGLVDKLSLKKTYEEAFAQGDKVLLLHDDEDDEAFYMLWEGKMDRMKGYYIFYERNEGMQAYMAGNRRGEAVEENGSEHLIEQFRAKMEEKKTLTEGSRREIAAKTSWRHVKIAGACVAALVLGVAMINYRGKLQELEAMVGGFLTKEETTTEDSVVVNIHQTPTVAAQDETGLGGNAGTGETTPAETEPETEAQTEPTPEETTPGLTEPQTQVVQPEETEPQTAEASAKTYLVQEGESLSVICRKLYGNVQRVQELCELNGIQDPDLILTGQILRLP